MASALIVYASLTGNTEEIADIVADQLEALGVDVEVKECTQVAPEDFLAYDMNIIATYTYGSDGDLPDEFMDFYEEMEDVDFTGKIAGVVGSGDTFYEYYCKAVDDFEAQFKKFGATIGAENVKIDLNAEEEDIANLQKFSESMVAALSN